MQRSVEVRLELPDPSIEASLMKAPVRQDRLEGRAFYSQFHKLLWLFGRGPLTSGTILRGHQEHTANFAFAVHYLSLTDAQAFIAASKSQAGKPQSQQA